MHACALNSYYQNENLTCGNLKSIKSYCHLIVYPYYKCNTLLKVPLGTYQTKCTNDSRMLMTESGLVCPNSYGACNCPIASRPNYCDCQPGK